MSKIINGIGVSEGIVIAKAYCLHELDLNVENTKIDNIEQELTLFDSVIKTTISQLEEIKKQAIGKLSNEELEVFDAHINIVQDPELTAQVQNKINDGFNCAFSLKEVTDSFIMIFESMDDDYFKARASDIRDIQKRLIANAKGIKIPDLSSINEQVIIVSNDLTPSETSQLNKEYSLGFVTNIGGRTSHAAIMARSMEIPAIVGTQTILNEVNDDDLLILNANNNTVIINPSTEEINFAKQAQEEFLSLKAEQKNFLHKKTLTKDNKQFELVANIGSYKDLEGVINNGAEGVGLYRTEFLYMDSQTLPDEETQFNAYKVVLEKMKDKPVVVRTLDIGGDKELPYLDLPSEMNPFLGYRAIRMCLEKEDIFRTQIRALLRASIFGNLKIMFPMITTIDEFRQAKSLVLEEKENLINEGHQVSEEIEIGIMIEIPAAAISADLFAQEVDFFSIGTNDLIQYTMACDRMNEKVSYLYQPYNPSILRLIKNVIDAANNNNIWAGMCGEMASDPIAQVVLVGLGLHEFSMSSNAILSSRMFFTKLDTQEIKKDLDYILNLKTAKEIKEFIENKYF